MFNNPTEVWECQMNELFDKKENEPNEVISALSILLNKNYFDKNTDIVDLYNTLDFDNFIKVMSLFERRTVTFPSKDELKEMIKLAVVFYFKEVKGLDWPEIKKIIPFEFSSISYSFKLKSMNKFMVKKLLEAMCPNSD